MIIVSDMSLKGKKVLMFVEDGYEDLEFWYPKIRLIEEGAELVVASKNEGVFNSKHGYEANVKVRVEKLDSKEFDCLIIPGGVVCPDRLRRHEEVLSFVRSMNDQRKIIASICHGPWVLISAGIVKGKKMTSYYSIKDDIENAGAEYLDRSVVVDGNVITSRRPDDLPNFCKAIIKALKG